MPTALIAEDEPLLAQTLQTTLQTLWPELRIIACVGDGLAALEQSLQHLPDVVFLDIRMPGLSGLEVATALAEDWPEHRTLPQLVFVTAYDQYALQAFETQALDYLLKPVQPERLKRTVERLQNRALAASSVNPLALSESSIKLSAHTTLQSAYALQHSVQQIAQALEHTNTPMPKPVRLQAIQASLGTALHRVPIDEVLFFAAADKYVRVVTTQREYLIRTPIKVLLTQLDDQQFWQIHRSTVVQAKAIAQATRDAQGKVWLQLHQHPERLVVSRLHTQRFKAM